jgi:uncharacterized membrane protein
MSFQEKSAWLMSVALFAGGIFYFRAVADASAALGELAPPNLPTLVTYAVILIVIAVVGHIVIAALAPDDANEAPDEREKRANDRAGHLSGYVLGIGVLLALGVYLFTYDGNVMFYVLFGSLMLSQMAEYGIQVLLLRTRIF